MEDLKKTVERYGCISFDIFNTIVLTTFRDQYHFFEGLGKEVRENHLLNVDLSDGEFAKLREKAGEKVWKAVHEDGGVESIEQIYEGLPVFLTNRYKELAQMELEYKCATSYMNLDMYELLRNCKNHGKKIYLISDMFFDVGQITNLLKRVHFDMNLIDGIYVSVDEQADKRSGDLFCIVQQKEQLDTTDWLHVGDDLIADVYGAHKAGVASYHFDIEALCGRTLMQEEFASGKYLQRFRNLRAMYMMSGSYKAGKGKAYKIGWTTLGPVLTYYTEWLIKLAKDNRIHNIYPLMREGVLISKLLNIGLSNGGEPDICVKPLYVSRMVTMFGKYNTVDESFFEMLMELEQVTITDLYRLLNLDGNNRVPTEYEDMYLSDVGMPPYKDELDIKHILHEYIFERNNKQTIEEHIKECNDRLYQYLMSELPSEGDYITCDVGYRGRIQTGMEYVLAEREYEHHGIHAMMFGVDDTIGNYLQNVDIRGALGNFGCNTDIIGTVIRYYDILESLFMDETGSTIGYERCGNRVFPTLGERGVSDAELGMIADIQAGILDYYAIYLKYRRAYPHLFTYEFEDEKEKREMGRICLRLFSVPDSNEAECLLHISFEQNAGSHYYNVTDYNKIRHDIEEIGIGAFLKKSYRNQMIWKEGILEKYEPYHAISRIFEQKEGTRSYYADMFKICILLYRQKCDTIIVYGAGDVGHVLYQVSEYFGIKCRYFVDRNSRLWNLTIGHSEIVSLDDERLRECNVPVVVASYYYLDEIMENLKQKYPDRKVLSVLDIG